MRRAARIGVEVALAAVVMAAARPAAAAERAQTSLVRPRPDVLMVLPVGAEQRHMHELIAELRRGLAATAAEYTAPRYRTTITPAQITRDRKVVARLERAGMNFGLTEDEERDLLGEIQRLPRTAQKGTLGGVLQTSLSISDARIELRLQLYELGPAGLELRLHKAIAAPDLERLRARVREAGRLLAVQNDQGGRPTYGPALSPVGPARVGRELALEIGTTADPEYDVFDWAWCQAEAPPGARAGLAAGRWLRSEREVRFAPDLDGQYTFLLWAGEVLRPEREPVCDVSSPHVAAIPVLVEPHALTLHALAAVDLVSAAGSRSSAIATRVGVNWRFYRGLGLRGGLDVFERVEASAAREAHVATLGAAVAGLSWDFRLGHDVSLRPLATLYLHLRDEDVATQAGAGLGTDVLIGLGNPWAFTVSLEGLRTGGGDGRWRMGAGVAYRR